LRSSHNRLDFRYRATVPRRMAPIPLDPPKLTMHHDITIYKSVVAVKLQPLASVSGGPIMRFSLINAECLAIAIR